jgi:thiamine-monophosphate kinase
MAGSMSRENAEGELIEQLRRRCGRDPRVPLGIGDDAALVNLSSGQTLVTTDMLMDGVDFIVGETPGELIGRKCLAVNLSDIAAMAGKPTAAFISLAIPRIGGRELAEELCAGLLPLAKEFDVAIAGGDTNSWDGPLVVNVTLLGEPTSRGAVTRSGAKPGDWVFVTGPLGGSLPSLRHCTFTPRIREALALQETVDLHAMIDLSDGLASDLFHIAGASHVGMRIDAVRVPIHDDVDQAIDPKARLHHAFHDGEDFELVFCVSPEEGRKLESSPPAGVRCFRLGECTSNPGIELVRSGVAAPLQPGGWKHRFD